MNKSFPEKIWWLGLKARKIRQDEKCVSYEIEDGCTITLKNDSYGYYEQIGYIAKGE